MKDDRLVDEMACIRFFQGISGLGPVRLRKIYEEFNSFKIFFDFVSHFHKHNGIEAKHAPGVELLNKRILSKLQDKLQNESLSSYRRFALQQLQLSNKLNWHIISFWDEVYPQRLYQTNQSVPLLYAIGDLKILNRSKFCSVVGTRHPSQWTKRETVKAVKRLVEENYVIVSGLAKGIDAISHKTALECNGSTIAVMGCGPDIYYPKENKELKKKIEKSGLIISEYPFGSKITSLSLKKRNKILVGLSDFVCITETSTKGGTMNSYLAALEQKKPMKVYLPISNVGGNFSGNLKIFKDPKAKVQKFYTTYEPNLTRLKSINIIIFDLDGTIWQSRTAILAAMTSFLNEKKVEFTSKDLEKKIEKYKSPYKVIKSYGNYNVTRFWKKYENNIDKIILFSKNTYDVFSKLVDKGISVVVVTSCKGQIAKKLLQHFDLNNFVSAMISPSDTRARKPSPIPVLMVLNQMNASKNEALLIGDEDKDIQAAHKAGCLAGLAAWNKYEEVTEKADYIFAELGELLLVRS